MSCGMNKCDTMGMDYESSKIQIRKKGNVLYIPFHESDIIVSAVDLLTHSTLY